MIRKLIFLLLIFLFLNKTVEATWTKYQQNPILSPGPDIWDKLHISSPTILYSNNSYRMWYQGYNGNKWSIGLAESTDGKSWYKTLTTPVLVPFNEETLVETDIVEPTVIKNDIYRIWFNSFNKNSNDYKIRYATSIDGISWQKFTNPVVIGEKEWENKGVANPSVIFKDGKYYMWYIGWGYNSPWQVGLAESADGISWSKYSNNPLVLPSLGHVSAPDVTYANGKYHMFYHTGQNIPTEIYYVTSTNGINWQCENNCSVIKSEGNSFDSQMMGAPTLYVINNQWHLFYSGFNGSNWQIGLAIKELPIPSKTPVVLIPGFMASWNKQAILHNEARTPAGWTMSPFVREYDGIINTFKNLGYNQDQDFFIYNYDWRKKLDEDADDIKAYLQQKIWNTNPQKKVNIIGHSLGGLVGRIFAQKYNQNNISSLITVGSPHRGTANVYKAVEGGEIDKSNGWLWLAEKLILTLNKQSFETDKETINQKLPVLRDILPTYDFLKKPNNEFLTINNMQIKNDNLINYNNTWQTIFPYLNTFVGDKSDSLFGYTTTDRTTLDRLLNFFPDGRPTENLYDRGDGLILRQSTGIGDKIKTFSQDHGEIIYTKNSIKEILNSLSIPYQENQISEGRATNLSPSLIFLIKSPAQIEVVNGGNTYNEQDGIIFIENAQSGDYTLKVKGQQLGRYTLVIGQITPQKDLWSQIEGEISQTPPTVQTDTYQIQFNPLSPLSPLSSPINLFDELILYLTNLNKTLNQTSLTRAIANLNQAKNFNLQNNKGRLKSTLLTAHQQILKLQLIDATEKLENLYEKLLLNYSSGIIPSRLKRDFDRYKQIVTPTQNYLLAQKNKGKMITKNALILKKIEEKLNSVGQALTEKNYNRAEILLKTVEELISEVRKL